MEYLPQADLNLVPKGTRGIYVLYKQKGRVNASAHHFDFIYIGMASESIRSRLKRHRISKGKLWSHFSYFEVWDNISDQEIAELEGLFRHLYRFDSKANALNAQRGYKKLIRLSRKTEKELLI